MLSIAEFTLLFLSLAILKELSSKAPFFSVENYPIEFLFKLSGGDLVTFILEAGVYISLPFYYEFTNVFLLYLGDRSEPRFAFKTITFFPSDVLRSLSKLNF